MLVSPHATLRLRSIATRRHTEEPDRRLRATGIGIALACVSVDTHAERVTLEDRRTTFQHLTVIEDTTRRERYLYSDEERYLQGQISLRRPDELAPTYLRSALLVLVFASANPSSMLFVGLGAGTLPRYLSPRYALARLDVVEIDAEVPPIARRYFALPAAHNLRVILRDGREFIREHNGQYDLVLIDAYVGAEIPPHLATLEFFDELRRVLRPGGVVVANLPAPQLTANFWPVLATYRAGFAHVRVYATESPAAFILLASNTQLALDQKTLRQRIHQLKMRHRIDMDLAALSAFAVPWESIPAKGCELRDESRR